ncbi:MAG TPA: hypothetical protein VMV01_03975 [Planctomycetota bacterium]|nr:hypothetical protein [Planctomycetota bacterium]
MSIMGFVREPVSTMSSRLPALALRRTGARTGARELSEARGEAAAEVRERAGAALAGAPA